MRSVPVGWHPRRRGRETVPRLLDAGIESLLELGSARCTPQAVGARAGVAPAALFHHFGTLEDFYIAVAEEVACRQLVAMQSLLDAAPPDEEPLETALRLLAELSSNRVSVIFLDLMGAARTDPVLAARLDALMEAYRRDIQEMAAQLPGLAGLPSGLFADLVQLALDLFRGTGLRGGDQRERLPLILALLQGRLAVLLDD
ncbi:TetR/AcrR family transcriptional regulator [Actinocorallia libanotica]|uniref:TetR/AcrR family transcriptional regulator n=1 Tax=Actinocorallia libanotica TaxID=46162 RepID=A0ABP4BWS1_9ACTN